MRVGVRFLVVVAGLLFLVPAHHNQWAALAAPAERPNIIFILTDDLDAKSIDAMPKLKSLLVDRGITFSNFFVSYALCCPSRASILRGQYAHNTGVLGNRPPVGGFEKFHELGRESSIVATWLKAAGYRTGYFGKYLNGYPLNAASTYVPPGWDEWDSPITNSAYRMFNYRMNENGKIVTYGATPGDYITDVLARKAVDFIGRGGAPFFIHLATYAPHGPATPAPRHAALFAGARAPRGPSFNEADVSDKPRWLQSRPQLTARQIARLDVLHRRRLQSLQAVDDLIATLIDTLRTTAELQRTYIFFSSDNGFHLGERRLPAGKNTAYEEDIRVPLIVIGPGLPAGRMVDHLAVNIDLAPTWAELAGAPAPAFVDGRSLVPLLGESPPPLDRWRQAFLIEHFSEQRRTDDIDPEPPDDPSEPPQFAARAVPTLAAVRTRTYVYIEYATGDREFYDVQRDPFELQNVAGTASRSLLEELAARLAALRRCAGAACRTLEDLPAPRP
jgi:N-acetylglucosamine-6-sulfatase